jgi:predicted CXXCH cytochrome family protein
LLFAAVAVSFVASAIACYILAGFFMVRPAPAIPVPADGNRSAASLESDSDNRNSEQRPPATVIKTTTASIPDPRVDFESPFRNIRPYVQYVGDAKCADCHQAISDTYHAHPMGRSAVLAGADGMEGGATPPPSPIAVGPYRMAVKLEAGHMTHELSAMTHDGHELPPAVFPVSIAVGSGTRGRSYLNVDGNTVWQSPISWYSNGNRWDVSPGYDFGMAIQRPTVAACLHCHLNDPEPVIESVNRFALPISPTQLSIGCERCHGPGQLHVQERLQSSNPASVASQIDAASSASDETAIDTSIVNPAHLSEDLQMAICGQCHLAGKARVVRRGRQLNEYRPGMPLELFINAFVSAPEAQFKNKAVGHFDQMLQSHCMTANGQRLTCTACHDPHQKAAPEIATQRYNSICNACHQEKPCNAPAETRQAQNDNCIHCHMPQNKNTNIAHTSFTDHRILRSPTAPAPPSNVLQIDSMLVAYATGTLPADENDRDLGIALARYTEKLQPGSEIRNKTLNLAKDKLTRSLERWPDDLDAWLALSNVGVGLADGNLAWTSAESAYKRAPKNEEVLVQLAFAAEGAGQLERSRTAYNALLQLNPASQDYRLKRMASFVASGDWSAAESDALELLRVNPVQPTARLVRGLCLVGQGEKAQGRREVEIAKHLATNPQQRAFIQGWFDRFLAWQATLE